LSFDTLECILGKLKAKKEAAAHAFNKTDVEEYDDKSDEIVIVTDADNDDSAVDELEAASVVVSFNLFGQNNHSDFGTGFSC
jgi:hypothetical protein